MQTYAFALRKAFTTNQNSSAFTAKVATITRPTNDGVLDLAGQGVIIQPRLRLMPYGLGSDNDVFSLRVWGWSQITLAGVTLWVPTALGEYSCTISTSVGVAASPVLATERFADTITIVATVGEPTITADVTRLGTVKLFSPANNTPAWLEMPTYGAQLLEFDTDQTTGTPTANVLVLMMGE